jgi:hypothetical protein
LARLLTVSYVWRALPVLAGLYAVLLVAGTAALWRQRNGQGLPILGAVIVPLIVCILAWALLHPMFGYIIYTFVWLRLPYAILIAAGVMALRPGWLRAGALAALLAGNIWGLVNYKATPNVPLDRVARLIAADARPGDGILLSKNAAARWGLAYYFGPPYAGRLVGLDISDYPSSGWPITTPAQALSVPRLWVVQPENELLPLDPAMLGPTMRRTVQGHVADILLERYDHAPP